MGADINWERVGFASRVDRLADDISSFVDAELQTIDENEARASVERWAVVCKFFAGCAKAALAQGRTPSSGGKRMAAYLQAAFPCDSDGSSYGFDDFMDWLSNPEAFRPTGLRSLLQDL
jgi:hypothetical protein